MVFPVYRSPAKASENVITDVDGHLMRAFFQMGSGLCRIISRQGIEIPSFETIPSHQLSLAMTSQVLNSAILMVWSDRFHSAGILVDQHQAADYVRRCYRFLRKSLNNEFVSIDVFYACVALFRRACGYSIPASFENEVVWHLGGLFKIAASLAAAGSSLSAQQWGLVEWIELHSLSLAEHCVARDKTQHPNTYASRYELLYEKARIFDVSCTTSPTSLQVEDQKGRLTILSLSINCLFTSYMQSIRSNTQSESDSSDNLRLLGSELIPLLDEFLKILPLYEPHIFDMLDASPRPFVQRSMSRDVINQRRLRSGMILDRFASYYFALFLKAVIRSQPGTRDCTFLHRMGETLHTLWDGKRYLVGTVMDRVKVLYFFMLARIVLPTSQFPSGIYQ